MLDIRSCKKLIYFQLFYVLIISELISQFGLPSQLTYLTDIVMALLILFFALNSFLITGNLFHKHIYLFAISYFVFVTMTAMLNLVSPQLYLWAVRNTFRGICFFFFCIALLDKEDIDAIFTWLLRLQVLNVILSLYQYFVLGYSRDYLGGIFGIAKGCNASSNVFFLIILTYYIVKFINKRCSFLLVSFVSVSTILLASLAELKVFYVEFILIIVICVLFSKPSVKTVMIIGVCTVGLVASLWVLEQLFPQQYEVVSNFTNLQEYANMTGSGYNISRLGAFNTISQLFFDNKLIRKLFGLGFGSCEMSTFDFLTSDFYALYGRYNYRWFAHMMIYLETGYVGLVIYIGCMVCIFCHALARKIYKQLSDELTIVVIVLSVMFIINLWYNNAIRTEIQYLTYFALSICFIAEKGSMAENRIDTEDEFNDS